MLQEMSATVPHKVVVTHSPKRGAAVSPTIPFGDPEPLVRNLEQLADADPGTYSPEIAYAMSIISAWAYADEKVLAAKLKYYGLRDAEIQRVTVQNNALLVVTTAYLIRSSSGNVGVLSFRGTDPGNYVTILTDADVQQRDFAGGKVHSGFHRSVEVVWDEIDSWLRNARNDAAPRRLETLYVTGHSLGGAMGLLAAARLLKEDYKELLPPSCLRAIYTFGQPMVGDAAFGAYCDGLKDRLFRHVYDRDAVPHTPPKSCLEYVHVGREYRSADLERPWRDEGKISKRGPLVAGLFSIASSAFSTRWGFPELISGYSLDDHMPANYVTVSRCGAAQAKQVATASNGARASGIGQLFDQGAHAAKRLISGMLGRPHA
jgi:hypothetical protein